MMEQLAVVAAAAAVAQPDESSGALLHVPSGAPSPPRRDFPRASEAAAASLLASAAAAARSSLLLAPRPSQPSTASPGQANVNDETGSGATDAEDFDSASLLMETTTTSDSTDPQKVIRCTGGGVGCLKRGNKKCSNHLCGPCCRRLQIDSGGTITCGDHNPRRDAAKSAARVQRRSQKKQQDGPHRERSNSTDSSKKGHEAKVIKNKNKRLRAHSAGRQEDATLDEITTDSMLFGDDIAERRTGIAESGAQDYSDEFFDDSDGDDDDDEQDDDYTPNQKRKRLTSSASTLSFLREHSPEGYVERRSSRDGSNEPSKLSPFRGPSSPVGELESNAARLVVKGSHEDAEVEIENTHGEDTDDEPKQIKGYDSTNVKASARTGESAPSSRREASAERTDRLQQSQASTLINTELRTEESRIRRKQSGLDSPEHEEDQTREQMNADSGVSAVNKTDAGVQDEEALDRSELVRLVKSMRAEMQELRTRQEDTENKLNHLLEGMRGWAQVFMQGRAVDSSSGSSTGRTQPTNGGESS